MIENLSIEPDRNKYFVQAANTWEIFHRVGEGKVIENLDVNFVNNSETVGANIQVAVSPKDAPIIDLHIEIRNLYLPPAVAGKTAKPPRWFARNREIFDEKTVFRIKSDSADVIVVTAFNQYKKPDIIK